MPISPPPFFFFKVRHMSIKYTTQNILFLPAEMGLEPELFSDCSVLQLIITLYFAFVLIWIKCFYNKSFWEEVTHEIFLKILIWQGMWLCYSDQRLPPSATDYNLSHFGILLWSYMQGVPHFHKGPIFFHTLQKLFFVRLCSIKC